MRADGSHIKRLTYMYPKGGRQAGFASYSPNGKRILFSSNLRRPNPDAPKNDVYKMRPDGSHIKAVVRNHAYVFQSDWGPRPRS
jgi:Tol biopolymer transport system component